MRHWGRRPHIAADPLVMIGAFALLAVAAPLVVWSIGLFIELIR